MACKIKIMLLSYSEGQCEVNKHSSLEPGCKVRVHFGCLNINYFKDYGGEWEILIGPLIACKSARGFRLARSWQVHPPVCQFSNYLLSVFGTSFCLIPRYVSLYGVPRSPFRIVVVRYMPYRYFERIHSFPATNCGKKRGVPRPCSLNYQ